MQTGKNRFMAILVACLMAVMVTEAMAKISVVTKKTDGSTITKSRRTKGYTRTIASIRIAGSITESQQEGLFGPSSQLTTRQWIERLDKARLDDDIHAIALQIDSPAMGMSTAMDLAKAIERVKKDKPVYTHIVTGGIPQYLLASAGSGVYMEPTGDLMIVGMAVELSFYKGTMDKWGLTPQFVQAGKYKGAAEPYMNTEPSEGLKKEYNALLDSLYDQICSAISDLRNISMKTVKKAIDNGPMKARDAYRYGFVDRLVLRENFLATIGSLYKGEKVGVLYDYGKAPREEIPSNPFALIKMIIEGTPEKPVPDNSIAIIHAEGVIMSGSSSGGSLFGGQTVGDRTIIKAFNNARKNEKIKAVIFRIKSPGGSALASEMMYQAVKRCAAKKPVIVSITGIGASGGYYIAMGGTKVIAEPMSIIGSIGVVGGKISWQDFMQQQRVTTWSVTRGKHAGLNLSRPWNAGEIATIRKSIYQTYVLFTSRVMESRHGKIKDIDKVAQGRIFTAKVGKELGLIDELGGLHEAIKLAKVSSKIKGKANFIVLPKPKTLIDMLMGDGDEISAKLAAMQTSQIRQMLPAVMSSNRSQLSALGYLIQTANIMNNETILMAVPYHVQLRY